MSSPLRNAALLLAVVASSAAFADGTATTFFDSRPYTRNNGLQEASVYESFALSARSEGTSWLTDVRLEARGWGRLTLTEDPWDGHRGAGDVDSLYLEGRLFKRNVLFRLGRQLAVGGAVRATQLDGLSAEAIVAKGVGLQAWAGVPVAPRFDEGRGDFLGGGRAFWRRAFDSEVGVSYVYALRRGYVARNDVAVDASWTPLRVVTVSGVGQYSLDAKRLAEARLQAQWQPSTMVQLVADVQRTAPDLFLDRTSLFSVFAQERRDQAGGEVIFRPWQPVSLEAEAHWISVEGGDGAKASLRSTYRLPKGAGSYGAELRLLTEPDNGYKLARVFAIRKLRPNLTLTADLEAYWLEREIRDSKRSFIGTLTAGYAITPAWDVTVAGSLGTTPLYERRTEIIARLVYRFGLPGGLPGGFL